MTSAAAITATIRSIEGLDISKSQESRGRVSSFINEGYKISREAKGWRISYLASSPHPSGEGFFARRWIALERLFIELSSAGFDIRLDGWSLLIEGRK